MCGICGKLAFKPEARLTENEIVFMRDTLKRRGPDDSGIYIDANVALGHRRLSIIDLEGSKQPISNEDGTVWIVYNGEVYNFQELRQGLEEKGHRFKTNGDTEVIIHLYEEYREKSVERLRGMFAFAIWDSVKKELFLARDRLGIKPLNYFCDDKTFIFGSEIKAILADKYYRSRKEFDLKAFHYFLSFLYVPAPLTMFKGIKKLLPAHWMRISQDGSIETQQYWNVTVGSNSIGMGEEEICHRLYELLEESVKIRLISDVPLGAFLSGGMDSSTVVATMARVSNAKVKTFSIGFSADEYNEAGYGKDVARQFGTDHTEMILDPADIIHDLPGLVGYFDEPFADSSLLPTYLVSKLAREKVTVVLSGDGGDELFGGYPWWQQRPSYQLYLSRLPYTLKRVIASIAPVIPKGVKGRHFLTKLHYPLERYMLEAKSVFDSDYRKDIYSRETRDALREIDPYYYNLKYLKSNDHRRWVDRIMEYDLKTYIPNDILTKVDRMSMYCSLEARVPLLDHELVEFAAQIPAELKIKGSVSKYILKKTMDGILPDHILHKPKQGFSVPLEDWLRNELKSQVFDVIFNGHANELFNVPAVEKLVSEFIEGNDDHKHRVWELYTFNSWYANHF